MMVRGLEISDLGSRGIILRVAKTKGLIVKLICVFVLACTKCRFSHNEAHIITAYTNGIYIWLHYSLVLYGQYGKEILESCLVEIRYRMIQGITCWTG